MAPLTSFALMLQHELPGALHAWQANTSWVLQSCTSSKASMCVLQPSTAANDCSSMTANTCAWQDVLQPVNAAVRSTAISISNYLQNKPNLDVAIPGNRGAQSWLLTTYLDDVSFYNVFLACMRAAWPNNPAGSLVTTMHAYKAEPDSDSITCLSYRCTWCHLSSVLKRFCFCLHVAVRAFQHPWGSED